MEQREGTVVGRDRTNEEWLNDLQSEGAAYVAAVEDLRGYLLKAIFLYYHRRRSDLADLAREELLHMAEDAAQDSIIKIIDKLDSFRGDSKFTTWSYRVAINQAAGELRRRQWNKVSLDSMSEANDESLPALIELLEDKAANDPALHVTRSQIWDHILEVINTDFTERQRIVFINQYFRDAPPEQIADQIGTNRNNVYKIAHDARMKLKNRLSKIGLSQDDILAAFLSDG